MVILKGYEVKQGEFEEQGTKRTDKYNSLVLHVESNERREVVGWAVENVRCSNEKFELIGVGDMHEALEKEVYLVADPTTERNGKLSISKLIVMGNPTTAPSGVADKKKE